MRRDRIHLGRDLLFVAAAVIPARDHRQPVALHDRLQLGRLARELAAKLGAGIAGLLRLAEADLERRVAAEFRHVVIGPGDRVDANANLHGRLRPLDCRGESWHSRASPASSFMSRRACSAVLRTGCALDDRRPEALQLLDEGFLVAGADVPADQRVAVARADRQPGRLMVELGRREFELERRRRRSRA